MNIWQQINDSAAHAIERVQTSLVQIRDAQQNIGAGTIWQEQGLILTNAHVVLGRRGKRRDLHVTLHNGDTYAATLLAYDKQRDVAALAIPAQDLPTVQLGNSRELQPGQWLMALGHPWGVLDALTAGVVIGTGDKLPEVGDKREWIALDMKMRPGHSGGPLFDADGRLVGINTMIRGPEVSFAVPVDEVKHFLKEALGTHDAAPIAAASATPPTIV